MAQKKQLSNEEVTETENKLIPILMNEPSELIELEGGVQVRFQRPTLPGKYRYQLWISKKLKEVGLDVTEDAESEFLFYWNYFGIINAHIIELRTPQGKNYTYTAKEDLDYKYLFEKYVGEEVYNKGESDETIVLDAISKFVEWQNSSVIEEEKLKNS